MPKIPENRQWSGSCYVFSRMDKLRKFGRLFVIKTRLEAMAVIYALALGAIERGIHYTHLYPGFPGYLLLACCTGAVFMAGAKLMEVTRSDSGERRRKDDLTEATAG